MFSILITESDAFLSLPFSTQALYFHLNMYADGDGFINNPQKIKRMIGASDEDLKLLITKRFILTFESGVAVIKHWRINNYIRKDTYKPTLYVDEFNQLIIKENGAYTEKTNSPLQSNSEPVEKEDKENDDMPYSEIKDLYNSICKSYPKVKVLTEKRKKVIKKSLTIYSIDELKKAFEIAENNSFLKGDNKYKWSADFDWLINENNITKILEGKFDKKNKLSDEMAEFYNMAFNQEYNYENE